MLSPTLRNAQVTKLADQSGEGRLPIGVEIGHLVCEIWTTVMSLFALAEGVKVKVLSAQSPNLNSRCEPAIESIQQECLDSYVVFGEQHLNFLVSVSVRCNNEDRAHWACGHLPPSCTDPPPENNTVVLNQVGSQWS